MKVPKPWQIESFQGGEDRHNMKTPHEEFLRGKNLSTFIWK
jgi:hypothetical protein